MADASRDQNFVPTLLAVSSDDGITPVKLWADPITHRLLTDAAGGGSVTSVSVVSANGFAGSVADATTTPAITLSTTITGILQGNGTAISAASTTGTGSVVLSTGPSLSNTGNVITLTNTTDQASNQVMILQGDRANPAANDEIYQSFLLSDSAGNQDEFGRITIVGTNVTSTSEVGAMKFGLVNAGSFGSKLQLNPTSLVPFTNDLLSLGLATQSFSDLFLASGAVVNFNNGNVVLTHSSGILTVSTGDLRVTTAGTNTASVVTVGGTQTLTGKTITAATLSGTQLLAEGASIGLDPALSTDGTWSGTTMTATAGYTQSFGDLVYLDPTDSRWEAVDANSAAGADGDARGILAMVVVPGTDGTACTLLLNGVIRADAKFPSFTANNPIYVSETAGSVTQTQPVTTDAVIRVVGQAITADAMYFNPSPDYITHV